MIKLKFWDYKMYLEWMKFRNHYLAVVEITPNFKLFFYI